MRFLADENFDNTILRGVQRASPDNPYSIEAMFKDNSGNIFSLHQFK